MNAHRLTDKKLEGSTVEAWEKQRRRAGWAVGRGRRGSCEGERGERGHVRGRGLGARLGIPMGGENTLMGASPFPEEGHARAPPPFSLPSFLLSFIHNVTKSRGLALDMTRRPPPSRACHSLVIIFNLYASLHPSSKHPTNHEL